MITKIIGEGQKEEEPTGEAKDEKPQHMFIIDDRDRFGEQKYPIAGRLNVPGPGAYDLKDNIEGKAQKITVV